MNKTAMVFLALYACNRTASNPNPPPGITPQSIQVTSTAFVANAAIPQTYTCDGKDIIPPLAWTAPPEGSGALVLVVDDPDAPGGVFTHLLAWNIKSDARALAEGASPSFIGATVGKNDFGKLGWSGPCPPRGQTHHYRFRLIAIDKPLSLAEGASRGEVDAALDKHVLGEGTLVGTFQH